MKFVTVPALALASVVTMMCDQANAAPRGVGLSKEHYHDGYWRLAVATDRFSGVRQCALRSRDKRVAYGSNALAFRIRGEQTLSNALFRIDGDAPMYARDQLPELARLGVATERTTNGGGSRLVLPTALLTDAHSVSISPKFGAHPYRFRLDGFRQLLGKAEALGCSSGTWITK